MLLQHDIIIVLGKRGFGKTTLVKQLLTLYKRRLIIDAHGYEYNDGQIFNSVSALFEFLKAHRNDKKFSAIFRPQADSDVDIVFAMAQTLQSFVLVCEESDMYIQPKKLNKNLYWLINYGRHINSSVILVARSVPEIAIEIRKEYTTFFCFKFTEPAYLYWLERYGFDAEKISRLGKHEFLYLGEDVLPKEITQEVKQRSTHVDVEEQTSKENNNGTRKLEILG